MIDKIYCENCLDLMARMAQNNNKVDIILTSPPYGNSIKISDKSKEKDMANTAHGSHSRYDVFDDTMSPEEYTDFVKNLFMHFDQILKPDGVILYNFSYSAQSVERTKMYWDILNMINNTNFLIIDQITWKRQLRCRFRHIINYQGFVKMYLLLQEKANLKHSKQTNRFLKH